jgi:hypothetical protein
MTTRRHIKENYFSYQSPWEFEISNIKADIKKIGREHVETHSTCSAQGPPWSAERSVKNRFIEL